MTKIIVGADASNRSEDAVAFARDFARATGAQVVLVAVYRSSPAPSRVASPRMSRRLEADAEVLLGGMRAGFEAVDTRAIAGHSPARALQALADEEGAALIVVGSSGRGRVGRVFPGSTAMRLAHGSPCALALVPRGYQSRGERRFNRIGCAFDTSDEARSALDAAVAATAALGDRLEVVHVFDTVSYDNPRIRSARDEVSTLTDYERSAREDLDEAVEQLPSTIAVEPVFVEGRASDMLAARSEQLDLLFAGSRGYGPLRAVLLGGVTHRLLHEAACPLIILPRAAEPTLQQLLGAT